MKNKELQRKLDQKKWLESEKSGLDKSGAMPYCAYCNFRNKCFYCRATQEERETKFLCSTAYNRMTRTKK